MSKIPVKGFKFYRDKKLLVNVIKDFPKISEERNDLVKGKTCHDMDSIKKLWRYAL